MKKVLKFCAAFFLIGVAIAVFAAIIRQENYPAEMQAIVKNEVLHNYYEKNGKAPDAYTHDPIDVFDYEGNIQAKHLCYIPEIGQAQISVRYGTVAFENIADKYDLDYIPELGCEGISFRLRAIELVDGAFSNEDKNVDDEDIISECYFEISESVDLTSGRHQYHRLVFDGIDFEKYNCLYLEMYYKDNEKPFTSIIIYHIDAAEFNKETVDITADDCKMP